MLRSDDIRYCVQLMRKHGVSYAFASRWLPPRMRSATAVLYAFFRVPDDLVDALEATDAARHDALMAWCEAWRQAQVSEDIQQPVLRAAREVFLTYHIPFRFGDDFLQAMVQDLDTKRYQTYADLERYMYGSAEVVGLMMSYVIGYKNNLTLERAKKLGEAMQLTNFLRDVQEDYQDRARIYLPLEDMQRFGVPEDDIRDGQCTPKFVDLMRFEIERARELYRQAEPGIDELTQEGRFAVRLASRLYAAILIKIEQAGYDVFQGRVRTTKFEKFMLLYSVWKQTKNTR